MIIPFLFGLITYTVSALISYSSFGKNSYWAYPSIVAVGVLANMTWLYIARLHNDPSKLALTGLYWDIMLTGVFLFVPIVFFSAKFSLLQSVGICCILIGIVLTKI